MFKLDCFTNDFWLVHLCLVRGLYPWARRAHVVNWLGGCCWFPRVVWLLLIVFIAVGISVATVNPVMSFSHLTVFG